MSQYDEFRSAVASQFSSAQFLASGASGIKLTIETPGAPTKTLTPKSGEYLCANDPQADIVLLGATAASGFRFAFPEGVAEIDIAALGADVLIDDTQLAQGELQKLQPPFAVKVGATTVRFASGSGVLPARGIPGNVKAAALVAVSAAALATFAPSRLSLPWISGPPAVFERAPEAKWTSPSEALAGATRVLARFDLTQRITATEQGKTVILAGEVGGSEVRRWQDALGVIRAQAATPVTTTVKLDPAESMSGRSIAGIAIAPERFVVTRSGQRVRIGETLPEGWMVREIDANGIVLERNGFSENIKF
jgi:hypothetical protein